MVGFELTKRYFPKASDLSSDRSAQSNRAAVNPPFSTKWLWLKKGVEEVYAAVDPDFQCLFIVPMLMILDGGQNRRDEMLDIKRRSL